MSSTPERLPEDWTPTNLPGPDSVIFLDPAEHPPITIPPVLCIFDDGEPAVAYVQGQRHGHAHHHRVPVCEGHLYAVVAREVTWI